MSRSADPSLRTDLLERIAGYVLGHGVADLSLRPMASAVGSSARMLLYHFGSKENIIASVLEHVRARQMRILESLRRGGATTPQAVCEAAFAYMLESDVFPAIRLFFETYALALRDPERFPGFFDGAVHGWLDFLAAPLVEDGADREDAMALATLTLAIYRGLMLDFAATTDRHRIHGALGHAMTALQSLTGKAHKRAR